MGRRHSRKKRRISRVRIVVSAVVLGFIIGVLAVELRAAIGYQMTVRRFRENSVKGAFTNVSFDRLKQMLVFSPKEETIETRNLELELELRYSWFSLFRQDLFLNVITTTPEPRQAQFFTTTTDVERPENDEPSAGQPADMESTSSDPPPDP